MHYIISTHSSPLSDHHEIIWILDIQVFKFLIKSTPFYMKFCSPKPALPCLFACSAAHAAAIIGWRAAGSIQLIDGPMAQCTAPHFLRLAGVECSC